MNSDDSIDNSHKLCELSNNVYATFENICMLWGENPAVYQSIVNKETMNESVDEDESEKEDEDFDNQSQINEISYLEIQYCVNTLSAQFYYRFGIQGNQFVMSKQGRIVAPILLITQNHPVAEIVSCLTCMKLNIPFVPIDVEWFNDKDRKIKTIIAEVQPIGAIVVASNESDPLVLSINRLGLFRIALIDPSGNLSFDDAMASSNQVVDDLSSKYETLNEATDGCENPLYIMYTSGSTGIPKGVMASQTGFISRLNWQSKNYPWQSDEVIFRRTPITFVDSIAEIFSALLNGIPIWCPPSDIWKNGGLVGTVELANQMGITRLTLLPSQLKQALVEQPHLGKDLPHFKYVVVSGEACNDALVRYFYTSFEYPRTKLINLFGSTELSGDVTYYEIPPIYIDNEISNLQIIPIGQPMEGNLLLIVRCEVETSKEIAKITILESGEIGELMVIGSHVGLGYFSSIDTSHSTSSQHCLKNFVVNPFYGQRMKLQQMLSSPNPLDDEIQVESYEGLKSLSILFPTNGKFELIHQIIAYCDYPLVFLSGDIVCQNEVDGLYYWKGRCDRQIKIRGKRIHLDAIQNMIEKEIVNLYNHNFNSMNNNSSGKLIKSPSECSDELCLESHQLSNYDQPILILFITTALFTTINPNLITSHDIHRTSSSLNSDDANYFGQIFLRGLPLKSYLIKKLSEQYLPEYIISIDQFPCTSSGKIDRMGLIQYFSKLLSYNDESNGTGGLTSILPQVKSMHTNGFSNDIIHLLVDIFTSILPQIHGFHVKTDNILDYSFFELGGTSFTAIEVLWQIRKRTDFKLSLIHLKLSISALALHMSSNYQSLSNKHSMNSTESVHELPEPKRSKETIQPSLEIQSFPILSIQAGQDMRSKCPSIRFEGTFWTSRGNRGTFLRNQINYFKDWCEASLNNSDSISHKDAPDALMSYFYLLHPSLRSVSDLMSFLQFMERENVKISEKHLMVGGIASSNVIEVSAISEKWCFKLNRCVDSSPVLCWQSSIESSGDGLTGVQMAGKIRSIVYIGSHDGDFYALDAENGSVIWELNLVGYHIEGSPSCSTDGSVVLITTYRGSDVDGPSHASTDSSPAALGAVWAVDAVSGVIRWMVRTSGEVKGGALIIRINTTDATTSHQIECAFVGCHDGHLYCIAIASGIVLGKVFLNGPIFAAPTAINNEWSEQTGANEMDGENALFVSNTKGIFARVSVQLSGNLDRIENSCGSLSCRMEVVWSVSYAPSFSSILLHPNQPYLYITSVDGKIVCLRSEDGVEVWMKEVSASPIYSTPIILHHFSDTEGCTAESLIIGSYDGYLRNISLQDGSVVWQTNLHGAIFSTAYLLMNMFQSINIIIVTTTSGEFHVLDSYTGRVLNKVRLPAEIFSSPIGLIYPVKENNLNVKIHHKSYFQFYFGCRNDYMYCMSMTI